MTNEISLRHNETLAMNYPAVYEVVRAIDPRHNAISITPDDILCHGLHAYRPGSAASYALQYNECPLAAVERALARGHEIYWLSQQASVISSTRMPKEKRVRVAPGDVVYFQGKRFNVVAQPNHNLGLVEIV